MFPFCEKSIPHQWECFRNQNYFALSAAAAAGLLLRVCSAGFASASFASAGRASAGCVPQALLHGHCFCGLCFCGFVPRFFRFAGANVGCSRPSGRQPNEDGGVRTAFRRRSGGVRVAFGWRSGASVCRRIRSGAASVFEQPDCRSTFERFLAIHSLRSLCFVIDPDIQKKEPPKRLLKCG